LKLVYWPSGLLKKASEPLTETPDPELVAGMKATMYAHHGIGISAVQVGVLKRLVVVDDPDCSVFVNPVIKETRGESVPMLEGCLSVPGFFENIWRAPEVLVSYQDENMVYLERLFQGRTAHILQHELEHLDGKLYLNHLPAARRSSIMGNMQALRKAGKLR